MTALAKAMAGMDEMLEQLLAYERDKIKSDNEKCDAIMVEKRRFMEDVRLSGAVGGEVLLSAKVVREI